MSQMEQDFFNTFVFLNHDIFRSKIILYNSRPRAYLQFLRTHFQGLFVNF
jgi:hypothetical protein